jgi:putative Mn2+ efflux pump MntP
VGFIVTTDTFDEYIDIKPFFTLMISFLLLTAFTVSIDSLVCGFSLAKAEKNKFLTAFIIALTVFFMCCIANYTAVYLSDILSEKTTWIGGLILTVIGIINLIKKDDTAPFLGSVKQSLITGFAVGIDGSVANLSLSLMGINAFYVPVIIALMHAVMVLIGASLRQVLTNKRFDKLKVLPPLVLIGLGVYKIISVFI